MIVTTYQARCDECPFDSEVFPSERALRTYMFIPTGDGKWLTLGWGRHVCRGCIIARACRIFGHIPDESNDWQCTRCMKRIGPSFEYAESCHFCGTIVKYEREYSGEPHAAQDCRPDLFEHEIGPTCSHPGDWCWWDHDEGDISEHGFDLTEGWTA